MNRKIAIIKRVVFSLLSGTSYLIKKNEKLIFFDDVDLIRYNELALVSYLKKNGYTQEYTIVYYTKKKDIAKKKYGDSGSIIYTDSLLRSLWSKLRAKYVFSELVGNIFACKPCRGQIIVQLWHGMALKTIGLNADSAYLKDAFSYMLCYSEFSAEIMKKDWMFDDRKVLLSQNPRDDLMFNARSCLKEFGIPEGRINVLWLPTFRNNIKSAYYDSNIDFPLIDGSALRNLDKDLGRLGINLIIKLHPLQRQVDFLQGTYKNIYLINTEDFHNRRCEFYEFIGMADAMLSDYSSVAIDYMLLDRPIGYVIDDIDEYNSRRGFHVDNPLAFMPGHHIDSYDSLISFLADVSSGKDPYREERHRINDILNKYKDSSNCRRVIEFVGINTTER